MVLVFDGWGEIAGRGAELLICLAGPHRQAVTKGCAPENYPFTPTADLLKDLRVKSPETLRRRVLRCRNAAERLAGEAGDAPPSVDALIETSQWHGYRLNPDTVRIVAITELTASK